MTEPSPLTEATVDSLEELFARDPLKLSDLDIDKIIEEQRAQRKRLAAMPEKTRAPKAKKVDLPELSAGDLFND